MSNDQVAAQMMVVMQAQNQALLQFLAETPEERQMRRICWDQESDEMFQHHFWHDGELKTTTHN